MKLNISREWFQSRIKDEDYEIGAGCPLVSYKCVSCGKPLTFLGRVKKGAMVIQHLEYRDCGIITDEMPTELEPVEVFRCEEGHVIYSGKIRERKAEDDDERTDDGGTPSQRRSNVRKRNSKG